MADDRASGKVRNRLAQRIDATNAQGDVEVVIELSGAAEPLAGGGTRQERIAAAKSSVERDLAAVSDRIRAAGGEVFETAWLNKTLRGRLPAATVARIAEDDAIAAIDLPHAIEQDA